MWRSCAPALPCWRKKRICRCWASCPTCGDIEDEDSLSARLESSKAVKPLDIAILRLPHISNFTDFMPLEQHPLLGVRYVQSPGQLGAPDVVILPGTKNTMDDLLWLRQYGLEAAVQKLAAAGTPVLGVCGGYQMLGGAGRPRGHRERTQPDRARAGPAAHPDVFTGAKRRTRCRPLSARRPLRGRAGRLRDPYRAAPRCRAAVLPPCGRHARGLRQGNVFGTYLHGLFDTGELTEKLAALLCAARGIRPPMRAALHAAYRSISLTCWRTRCARPLDMNAVYAPWDWSGQEHKV